MNRLLSLALAATLCLTLAACQTPAEPEPPSALPPASQSENPPLEPSPSPEPEPMPETSEFAPAPGWECRVLLTQPGEQSYRKVVLAREHRAVVQLGSQLFGVHMETGEIAFRLPVPEGQVVCRLPSAPGAFRLAGEDGFWQYLWGEEGAKEALFYTLPQKVREAGEGLEFFRDELWWDALPEQNLLTWVDEKGVWVSAADGSSPSLAVPAEAVYDRPEYDSYLEDKQARTDGPVERKDCISLGRPRLMQEGRTLVLPVYNRVSLYTMDDILTVDLATGEQHWYWGVITGKNKDTLWFLDDNTILAGYTLLDLTTKTSREILHSGVEDMLDTARSGDFVHFLFGRGQDGNWEYRMFTWDSGAEQLSFPMDELWESAQPLFTCPESCNPRVAAIDGTRFLFEYRTEQGELGLLLVTPE